MFGKYFRLKVITVVIAAVMLCVIMFGAVGVVHAASEEIIAPAGGQAEFTVSIEEGKSMAGFRIFLEYDTSALSLAKNGEIFSVEQGGFSSSGTLLANTTETGCQVLWYNTTDVIVSGTLFTVVFDVAADASLGDYPITVTVSEDDTVTAAGVPVDISCSSGSITVVGTNEAVIESGSVVGYVGSSVQIPVSISNNPGFASFSFAASYEQKMVLKSISEGTLLEAVETGSLTPNISNGNVNWTASNEVTADGEILVLELEIPEDCPAGSYPISIALIEANSNNFVDIDLVPIAASFISGVITVYDYMPGDVDLDGFITPYDLVMMAKHIVGLETLTGKSLLAADLDKDSYITSADCVILAKYLVEIITVLE